MWLWGEGKKWETIDSGIFGKLIELHGHEETRCVTSLVHTTLANISIVGFVNVYLEHRSMKLTSSVQAFDSANLSPREVAAFQSSLSLLHGLSCQD